MPSLDPPDSAPLQCSLHDWNALRLHLIFAYDQTLARGQADGVYVRHGEYSAWLIKAGSVQLESDNEHVVAGPGEWVFCFGNRVRQKLAPGTRMISLRLANSWPNEMAMFVAAKHSVVTFPAARFPQLEALAMSLLSDPQLQQKQWHGRGDPSILFGADSRMDLRGFLRHQRLLLDWTEQVASVLAGLGWGVRVPRGVDSVLADALNVIDTLPYDMPFPGPIICDSSGLTQGQLNRMCVRALGLTTYAYWERRRLQRARSRLGQPSVRIKQISAELGFKRLSHFSTWFKRHDGHSPRAFARTARSTHDTARR